MTTDSHRLSILTNREIEELYGRPQFTQEERLLYFDLSPAEHEAVGVTRSPSTAAHFILQTGYFKAKRQFFVYEQETVSNDLRFIIEHHFPGTDLTCLKMPFRHTRLEQQRCLLKLFGYRLCDITAREELEQKAQRVAMLSTHPLYLLREMLQFLTQQRIVAPAYSVLQDMVGRVITREIQRVTLLLETLLPPDLEVQLNALLQAEEGMYRISAFKHEPRDFSYNQLRQEVERRKVFQPLSAFAKTFLTAAGISNESARYYASLVPFYTVYKLQRMAPRTAQLYLLCFAFYRFRQINDNLIEAFLYWVNQYEEQAKQASEEALRRAQAEATQNLQAAGQVLTLFVDPSIAEDTPFAQVKEKAFSLLAPEQFPSVSNYMRSIAFDKTGFQWAYYTKLSLTFKRNLRHLFLDIMFEGRVEEAPLMEAVRFFQDLLRQGKTPRQAPDSTFPLRVIPKSLQPYLGQTQHRCIEPP